MRESNASRTSKERHSYDVVKMRLNQLRYFVGIVNAGSFTAASKQLLVAQSALSRQINELEKQLGVLLLNRGRHGVTLTEEGQHFYERMSIILDQLYAAQEDVQNGVKGTPHGSVRVALPVGAAGLIGPLLVQHVANTYAAIKITIVDGMGNQAGNAIESGAVDFGLIPNAERLSGVVIQPVLAEYYYLASKRVSSDVDMREISLAEIEGIPLVMPNRSVHLRRHIEAVAAKKGHQLNVLYEQQSFVTIISLVKAGLCSAILNWPTVHELWTEGKLDARRISDSGPPRVISLVSSNARPMSIAAKATYDLLYQLLIEQVENEIWKGELIT